MSTTIKYNNETIATATNQSKLLKTAGTYMEGDILIADSSPTYNTQAKTGINPSTSSQTITPDSGYDALSSVQINAMPVGSAGTPTATKGTVSNHSVSVTPSVTNTTGYITGGTKTGTAVTVSASELVSGSETKTSNGTYDVTNLAELVVNVPSVSPTIQSLSITPTESEQTFNSSSVDGYKPVTVGAISTTYVGSSIARRSSSDLTASGATVSVPSGYYASNTSKAVASGTEGTPTATKGTVSNHTISVTPSVTNSAGYISGGTKTGTAVSVSASELVSGTKSITANGTGIDVTNYASVDVAVPSEEPSLQAKTGINPSTSSQTITADAGYDGLSSVQINAMTEYDGGHQLTSYYIVSVSLTNPVDPENFYSVNVTGYNDFYYNPIETVSAEIDNPYGSVTLIAPLNTTHIVVDLTGDPSGWEGIWGDITISGGAICVSPGGMESVFEITGDASITIDRACYCDD